MKYKILIIIGVFLVSFAGLFVKLIIIEPSVLAMYRLGIGGLILLPFAIRTKDIAKFKCKEIMLIIFAGLAISLHYFTWFTSLRYTSVTSSTLIICSEPLVALIFGFALYREKIAFKQFIILIIALIGVSIVAWGDIYLNEEAVFGDIITFISVIFFVIYLFIGQSIVKKYSFVTFTSFIFLCAAIILFIYNFIMGYDMIHYNIKDWIILLLMGIIPNAGQLIFNYTLRYVKSALVATSILLEPIIATMLVVIFLGNAVFLNQIIGGIIIIVSVYIYIKIDHVRN